MEVHSELTTIDEITRKATVTVPTEKFNAAYENELKKIVSRVKINGFRPGKAPRQMVETLHGESVKWEVISKIVSETLHTVVTSNSLQMVGSPKIDILKNDSNTPIEYTAEFSIYPTPVVSGYKGVAVEVEKDEVDDLAVNKVIDTFRRSKSTPKDTSRTSVQSDDIIDISVVFKSKDGSETTPEVATIGLGDGRLPKEFDEQVIGMNIGDTKEVKLSSGEEGELIYIVTLNKISQRELPEVTDEFVIGLGLEDKSVKDLLESTRKRLEEQSAAQSKEKAKNLIVEKLVELNPFQLPQPMIDDEIRNLLIRVGAVDPNKTKFEDIPIDPFRESFGEMAAKRVKANIVVDQVATAEKISPNDADMKSAFQEIATQYRVSESEARKMFTGNSLIHLAVEVTRSKTQDFLFDNASISYTSKK